MSASQSQGLLHSFDVDSLYTESGTSTQESTEEKPIRIQRRRANLRYLPWVLHGVLLLCYGILLILTRPISHPKQWPDIYDGIKYTSDVLKTEEHTPFDGRPTEASEREWQKLLNVGIVSITENEKSRLPFETAHNIFEEKEYVVELAVFHQLHCLHGLRKQLWNPRHIEWKSGEPVTWWEFHMNHCIEYLRQSLMCAADMTPQRFLWDEEMYSYSLDQVQQFQCKNWQEIWDWAETRNTTGDFPSNLKGLEKDGKISDASDGWEEARTHDHDKPY